MKTWFNRLRERFASAQTGNDFIDSCCHRIGGKLRAGSPTRSPEEYNTDPPR